VLAETTDAVVECQDKLITAVYSKAKKRRDELLRAGEEAKRRAVEVLGVVGELVLDDTIPDVQLRNEILWRIPSEEMAILVDGCQQLRDSDDGSHLWHDGALVQQHTRVLASATREDAVPFCRAVGVGPSSPVPAPGQPRAPTQTRT
jgi:hypothetical protein